MVNWKSAVVLQYPSLHMGQWKTSRSVMLFTESLINCCHIDLVVSFCCDKF